MTHPALSLIWRDRREPDPETTALARNFATQIAIAVQDARLRRQAEQVRTLTELARLKDEFIATASHELRTPLTALLGFSELLTRGRVVTSSQPEVYQRIYRSVRQLSHLVDDLLDVSRLDAGRLVLEPDACDLVGLIHQVATEMASVSAAHRIVVETATEAACRPFDEKRIRQVLTNLVNNAIRYSPDGGCIAIGVRDAPDEVAVVVQDEGIGIPPESVPRVFEKFYRAPNATRTAEATGLGLAVCCGIVEAHGGRIWAESAGEGRGSRFTFTLPRADNQQ